MTAQKFLKGLEFLSTVGFAVGFFLYDLYVATSVLMALLTLLMIMTVILKEPINKLQLWSWMIVVVFGGATVLLKDGVYIKWKPTIINAGIGIVLLGSHLVGQLTVAERLLGKNLRAPTQKLRKLNFVAACYAFFLSLLNIYIAFNFEEKIWVNFKVFGLFALNMAFFIACYMYLAQYVKEYFDEMQKKKPDIRN